MAEVILTINGRKIENTFTKLRTETRALERELRNLTPGTEAFTKKAQEVKKARTAFNKVNKEIVRMRKEIDKTGNFFTRFIKKIGGWQNILTGIFSSGALFSTKATVDELLKISDAITDVQKTSGLSKKAVDELWHELSDLDTRTSKLYLMNIAEIGGRLGIQSKEELKTFTEEIDKAYVALGDSFSGGLEAVTTKLGKMKNLFAETKNLDYGTAINQIGSALNELAAQGTASEENISDFAMRVGQLPEALKPAGDKILGLGAAFEESGLTAEIASSGYSRFMLSAANNIDAFAKSMGMGLTEAKKLLNEKPEEFFIRFSQGMKGLDATQTAKIFKSLKLNTQEITKAVGAAAQNSGRFYEMMSLSGKAMGEATSLTDEFNNKNTNSAAIWEKIFKTIKNTITDGAIPEMFDRISAFFGKLTGVLSENGNGVQVFTRRLLFLIKTLTIAGTTFISYRAGVWLSSKATKNLIQQTILHNTVEKIGILRKKVATGVTLLYAAAKNRLTGNTKRAAAAMRMFNMVTKMNPIGLLIGTITAVIGAMALYSKETKKVNIATKALADAEKEAAVQNATTKRNLEELLKIAQDETKSKKERQKAVDELNRVVPQYNKGLTIETANTKEAKKQLDKYIESLKDAAREKYLKSLVDKKAEEIAKQEHSSLDDNIKWYERTWNAVKSLGNPYKQMAYDIKTANKNKQKLLATSNEELKKLEELHQKQKSKNKTNPIIKTSTNIDPEGDGDKDDPKTSNSSSNHHKKAIQEQQKTNKKLLNLQQQLEDEKFKIQEDSLNKQLELLAIEYDRKKQKINQENTEIQKAINETNDKMSALRDKKTKKGTSKKEKQDIDEALKVYHEINKKRVKIKQENNAIISQLNETHLYKQATLKEKWFAKEIDLERKKIDKKNERVIDEINTIKTFEEAKQLLQNEYGVKDISKIKTIVDAKNKLREEANKKALAEQIKFLENQSSTLKEELKNITGPAAEELKKNLQFLEEKLLKVKGVLQGKVDEENSEGAESAGTDLGEAGSLDILGFSAQQWVTTFENLDTTEGKLQAVGMAMQALANAGSMFAEHQKRINEKELKSFTKNQERRKKILKNQLDSGIITQEQYHNSVEQMERDAANKKAEMEYKQAKADKVARLFSAIGNVALGISSALTAPFPMNIALPIIIGALGAVQVGLIASQPLPPKPTYATGGFTKGLGFKDETNHEVAGTVHANEYVVPEWLLKEPRVANVVGWIEAKRTKTNSTFSNGGYTSPETNEEDNIDNENVKRTDADSNIMLMYAINRLNEILEKLERDGLEAFLLADAKNGKLMHSAIKQFESIKNKNKR